MLPISVPHANPYTLRRGGGLETDAPFGLHKLVPKFVRDDFRGHALLTPDAASKVMLSEYKQLVQWLVEVDKAYRENKPCLRQCARAPSTWVRLFVHLNGPRVETCW